MKKRILAMLLAAVLAVGLLPGTALAFSGSTEGTKEPAPTYDYDITWSYSDGVLTIDGKGYMLDYLLGYYEDEDRPWKDHSGETHTVVIGDGLASIGMNAFNGFESLTSVTIPTSVTSIGTWAFFGCSSLTSVTIPASVTSIHGWAFSECDSLTDVYYGGSESQWGAIMGFTEDGIEAAFAEGGQIGPGLGNVKVHYNSTGPEAVEPAEPAEPEEPTEPTEPETPEEPTEPTTPAVSFTDVADNAYYAPAVAWAANSGVTDGYSDGTFRPNDNCSRAQIVTFLWRAYGKPEPTTTENPFTDVKSTDYYYKAVLWAVENNITGGTGDGTTFTPDGTCTRKEAVTFQYRAADKPDVTGGSSFSDVSADEWYADAVAWAVANKVTSGTGDGTTFSPNDNCIRGQIVTFLYKDPVVGG